MRILICISILFLACCKSETSLPTGEAYKKEIEQWDKERAENLKAEDGWLNVAGRFVLVPGKNTVGMDRRLMVAFTPEKGNEHIGYAMVEDSLVSFTVNPGIHVYDENKKPFNSGVIYRDTGDFKTLSYGGLRFFVIERNGKYIMRLRDLESEALKNFSHIDRFPVDESWRIEADFVPAKEKKTLSLDNVIGTKSEMEYMGTLHFERDGKEYSLQAVLDEDLFIIFADQTTGKETYHSGRFLHAPIPKEGEKVLLDFNKAYNPPCAFTDFATCPLPPKENRLPIRIEAGEKKYGIH